MSATASASAAACTPQTKLLMSFIRAPLPVGPRWMMPRLPIAASAGRARSSAAAGAADEKQQLA